MRYSFQRHPEIFNMLFYEFSEHSEIFRHAFLQFSEHSEIFNMLFYSFQNILKFSTCFFTVFRTCWNFQHTFKHENLKQFTVKFYFYVVQIYVNQGSYKLSDWPAMVDRSITDLTVILLLGSLCKLIIWEGTRRDITVKDLSHNAMAQKMLMILVNEKGINYYYKTLFQYAYNMHYRFQHALKFSTHFQT